MSGESKSSADSLSYHTGFGSHIESESLPNVLPQGQNNPQKVNYGLYAEQLSGTAFTVPRLKNQRTWLYRIRPSVVHNAFEGPISHTGDLSSDMNGSYVITPRQLRWSPFEVSDIGDSHVDFVDGLKAKCGAGDAALKDGMCIYNYVFNANMLSGDKGNNKVMCNADGDFLIVPQQGTLLISTEMGKMQVEPQEICVIPRGIKFSINRVGEEDFARGYVCELFRGHFELPNLGPIGANGLANPRDFEVPMACYEDIDGADVEYTVIQKFMGSLFVAQMNHSPFDVVGWHGNYYPYKYDLRRFNVINTVTFDHPDPSIFTVLTAPTDEPGVAAVDFVIFSPRWMVAEKTFRPPYYHRNCMSEYMGMVYGKYDAKEGGFVPGGASLHSCMSAHGPDANTFEKASNANLEPQYFDGGLAFMFETTYLLKIAPGALNTPKLQADYQECWQGIKKNFSVESTEK